MARHRCSIILIAAYIVFSAAQPVDELPVLQEQPAELLFKSEQPEPFQVPCAAVDGKGSQLKYSWKKNGQPFDLKSSNALQKDNEGTLVFNKPSSDIEGKYQCFAESNLGVASSRVISVKRAYINTRAVVPATHKPVEGKPFTLECPVPEGYPKPTVSWTYSQRSRRLLNAPDGTLTFSNVTQEDVNTKYTCQAESPAVDKPVVLEEREIVEVLPKDKVANGELVPQYLSQDMVTFAGKATMIYCIYGGTPLAFPKWYFEGQSIGDAPGGRITRHNRSSGRRLLIKDTYLTDQGTYSCEANNEVGKPQKHTVRLTVVSPPEFVKKPESKMIVKQGQDVTLPCQVKGVDTPKVTRTYNSNPLNPSDRLSVANAADGVSVADITIKNVQKSDAGYYGCKAENEYGDLYAETLLNVV